MIGGVLEKIIKLLIVMMINKISMLSAWSVVVTAMVTAYVHATVIAVPEPKEMLIKANFSAAGRFVERGSDVYFVTTEIFKGKGIDEKEFRVAELMMGELMPPSILLKAAAGKEQIFVGDLDRETGILKPIFGLCSVWPNGTTKELLPFRSFPECEAFVRQFMTDNAATNLEEATRFSPSQIKLEQSVVSDPIEKLQEPPRPTLQSTPLPAPPSPTPDQQPQAAVTRSSPRLPVIPVAIIAAGIVGIVFYMLQRKSA
jgi:hypothetical protein